MSSARAAPTIVFDLDGTLIDTAPDLVDALNVVFARENLPPVPYDRARLAIGGGARKMIVNGLALEGREPEPALLERLFRDFIAYYSAHIADRSRPFPGVERTLDDLAARGCALAVCTNKFESLSVQLLERLGMASRFVAICGQDTFGVQKPDPLVLHRTIEKAGGKTSRAVMVGDSETDIRTARAAGVPVVAVDFGYSDPPVSEFHPDRLISHFGELTQALDVVLDSQ
jgi:phosphoglycolate phosphatase